jgi:hypothetical protein
MDTPGMGKWDTTFTKHAVVENYPEENGIERQIEYLFIKFPLMMDNRDIVQEKKVWKEYNGDNNRFLSLSKSIVHPSHPVQKKVVRAEMIISGIYLHENSPNDTSIFMVNNVDLKLNSDFVNKAARKSPKDFLENLTKYCRKMSK